jgi:hypothetical protein
VLIEDFLLRQMHRMSPMRIASVRVGCQRAVPDTQRLTLRFASSPAINSPAVAKYAVIGAGFAGVAVVHQLLVCPTPCLHPKVL